MVSPRLLRSNGKGSGSGLAASAGDPPSARLLGAFGAGSVSGLFPAAGALPSAARLGAFGEAAALTCPANPSVPAMRRSHQLFGNLRHERTCMLWGPTRSTNFIAWLEYLKAPFPRKVANVVPRIVAPGFLGLGLLRL